MAVNTIVIRAKDYIGASSGASIVSDPLSVAGDVVKETQQLPVENDSTDKNANKAAAEVTIRIPVADLQLAHTDATVFYSMLVGMRRDGMPSPQARFKEYWYTKTGDSGAKVFWIPESNESDAGDAELSYYLPTSYRPHYSLVSFTGIKWTDFGDGEDDFLLIKAMSIEGSTESIYLDMIYFVPSYVTGYVTGEDANQDDFIEEDFTDFLVFDPSGVWFNVDDQRAALSDSSPVDIGQYSVLFGEEHMAEGNWRATLDLQEADNEPTAIDVYGYGDEWNGTGTRPRDEIPDPTSKLHIVTGSHQLSTHSFLRDEFIRGPMYINRQGPYDAPVFYNMQIVSFDFAYAGVTPGAFTRDGLCPEGMLMVVALSVVGGSAPTGILSGWTLLGSQATDDFQWVMWVYYKVSDGTTTEPFYADVGSSGAKTFVYLNGFYNIDTSDPIMDFTIQQDGVIFPGDPGTLSPGLTVTEETLVDVCAIGTRHDDNGDYNWSLAYGDVVHAPAGSFTSGGNSAQFGDEERQVQFAIAVNKGQSGKGYYQYNSVTLSEFNNYFDDALWGPVYSGPIVCVDDELIMNPYELAAIVLPLGRDVAVLDYADAKRAFGVDTAYAFQMETKIKFSGLPLDKANIVELGVKGAASNESDNTTVGAIIALDDSGNLTLRLNSAMNGGSSQMNLDVSQFVGGIATFDFSSEESLGTWADPDEVWNFVVQRRFYHWRAKAWLEGDDEPDWIVEGHEPYLAQRAVGGPPFYLWVEYPYEDNYNSTYRTRHSYPLNLNDLSNPVSRMYPVIASWSETSSGDNILSVTLQYLDFSYPFDDTGVDTHLRLEKYDESHDYGSVVIPYGAHRLVIANTDHYHFADATYGPDRHGFNLHLWKDEGSDPVFAAMAGEYFDRRMLPIGAIWLSKIRYRQWQDGDA